MKSVKIKNELHKKLKIFCVNNNITISSFLETIIKDKLKFNDNNEKS